MLYVASFFNPRAHHGSVISIANTAPAGFRSVRRADIFVPGRRLVWDWKDGRITWPQYTERYMARLDERIAQHHLDRARAWARNPNRHLTLCCWEREPTRCHRSLLAEWLRERGIPVHVS